MNLIPIRGGRGASPYHRGTAGARSSARRRVQTLTVSSLAGALAAAGVLTVALAPHPASAGTTAVGDGIGSGIGTRDSDGNGWGDDAPQSLTNQGNGQSALQPGLGQGNGPVTTTGGS